MRRRTLLVLVVAVGACTSSGGDRAPSATANASDGRLFVPTALPHIVGDGYCDHPPAQLNVCEWVASFDALVVGTIDRIDPIRDQYWVNDDESGQYYLSDAVPDCADAISIGVAIHLDVSSVLHGSLTPNKSVVINVGARQADSWNSNPREEADGSIRWTAGDVLGAGTTAGFPITQYSNGKWGLAAASPIGFGEDGSTVFTSGDGCGFVPPASPPTDFWKLESEVASCGSAKNDRYDARLNPDGAGAPSFAYASIAYCLPTDSHQEVGADAGADLSSP